MSRTNRQVSVLLFTVSVLFAVGCGGEVDSAQRSGAPSIDDAQQEDAAAEQQIDATTKPTFTNVKAKVFAKSCGGVAFCHMRGPLGGGMDLTDANAYASLVATKNGKRAGVAANINPKKQRVVPGDAASSFLYQKLTGTQDLHTEGNSMPRSEGAGWHPITTTQLNLVKSWINAGALNN